MLSLTLQARPSPRREVAAVPLVTYSDEAVTAHATEHSPAGIEHRLGVAGVEEILARHARHKTKPQRTVDGVQHRWHWKLITQFAQESVLPRKSWFGVRTGEPLLHNLTVTDGAVRVAVSHLRPHLMGRPLRCSDCNALWVTCSAVVPHYQTAKIKPSYFNSYL
jgi:hypothetical protein